MQILLRADMARLTQDLNNARRAVGGAMDSIGTAVNRAMGLLAGLGLGLSLGSLLSQVVAAQREFDKLNASLVTATGSTANAAQAFSALQAFAASTPYSVQEATEAFIKMRNLGLDPSEKALRSYGNTASAMGKGLNQMVEAVADAATGEFERLKEFGIKAKQNGDLVSLTFQGVTKSIGNNAKEIEKYLQAIGETEFAGGMERRAATLDGAISNLGDTWQNTLRTIASNGIGDAALGGVLALSNALGDLSAILDAVGGAAHKEGQQVKEASVLHQTLTAIFETVAVLGTNVFYVLTQVGKEMGGLAAQAVAVAHGDFAGATAISKQMKIDAEADRKAVDEKSAAIVGAAKKAQDAQESQAAAQAKSGKDRLAQYAIVQTAEEKRNQALLDLVATEQRITGVSAESLADLKKLKTALDTGAISQDRYNFLKGKLSEQMYQNSLAGKEEAKSIEKSIEAIKKRADMTAILNDREKDRIAFLQRTGQMNQDQFLAANGAIELKALTDQRNALTDQLALLKRKHDSQKEQIDLAGQIGAANEKIITREIKLTQDLAEEEHRLYLLAANNTADLIDAARAEAKTQQDKSRDMQDEIDALGMTERQIAEVTAARLRDQAAALDRRAEISMIEEVTAALHAQADELRKQADLGLTKERLQENQRLWNSVETTAHDTFVSIFDSGKSAFDRLRDTLKNGLLDLLYQMVIKKWVLNIGASVGLTSASGLAEAAGVTGASGATGGSTGLIGLAQSASSLYKVVSGGFSSLSGSVADAIQLGFDKTGLAGIFESAAPSVNVATGITGNGTAATMGGSVAGIAAGVLGGLLGGNLISGQYGSKATVGVGTAVGAIVGSVVPVIGTAIGALVGGLLGGIGNRLFGMGDKNVTATGMSGTLSDAGLAGSNYSKWTQKGGWFRSDKSGTDKSPFDEEVTKQFVHGFATIKAASAGFATSLGASTDSLAGYSKTFDIALTKDAAANEKAITDFFTGVGDEIALRLVPGLAQFNKSGETMATTLQRLAGDFDATNQVAMLLGKNGASMFGSLTIDSAAARERLIEMAGGVSNLTTQATAFAQNYLTEAERLAPVSEAVAAAMSSLGLASVTTRDQFKTVVQGLDVTTAAGAQQFASLMALSDAFAQVHPAIEATTAALRTEADILSERADLQKQLNQLTMSSAELLAKQRDALDASNRGLFDQIQVATAAKKAQDDAKASLSTYLGTMTTFANSVKGFNSSLAMGSLSTLTPEQQYAEARRQFEQARTAAAAGDTTAQGALQGIENAFLTISQKINGSDAQYSSDLATVMSTNDSLAKWAAGQVDVAQASLDALNKQTDGIAQLNATMLTVAQNSQYLPTLTGNVSAPVFTTVQAPTIDFTSYGNAIAAPLIAEIKLLREEVKGRRADAVQQTGAQMQNVEAVAGRTAATIVDGMHDAVTDGAYAADNNTRKPT